MTEPTDEPQDVEPPIDQSDTGQSQADQSRSGLRRSVYLLLICIGTGAMLGRIAAVDSVDMIEMQKSRDQKVDERLEQLRSELVDRGFSGDRLRRKMEEVEKDLRKQNQRRRPFLSANDRSRMCTLRALVEEEMRVDGAPYAIDKVIQEPTWDTIDMVKHGRHGSPPLDDQANADPKPWQQSDGKHLYSSKPPLLPTIMAGEYWIIHKVTGMTLGTHPYTVGRIILVTFNVLPLVLYFVLLAGLIERFGRSDWGRMFVMAAAVFGTFLTTFAVVVNNHLPAAVSAMIAIYAAVRIWFDGERRLRYFAIAGLFAAFTAANELPAASFFAALSAALLWKAPKQTLLAYVPAAVIVAAGFFGTNWIAHQSLKPAYMHRDAGDNWYDYEYQHNGRTIPCYWEENRVGVDKGEKSPWIYAMHVLIGHHGIFSLTPIWLLSVAGAFLWLRKGADRPLREFTLLIVVVSLVCLAFYLSRGQFFRNYGGMTSGLRWMFWFAPMWLLLMLPVADAMASRWWTRGIALAALLISVLSVTYPTWNPWVHPWLMNYLHSLGWLA